MQNGTSSGSHSWLLMASQTSCHVANAIYWHTSLMKLTQLMHINLGMLSQTLCSPAVWH